MNIGAKTALLDERWDLIKELSETMDFIEVYYTEHTIETSRLSSLDTRWVVHGPHIGHGVNLAKESPEESKIELFENNIIFAHDIGAGHIITHAGYCNSQDDREIILENMINNIKLLKKFSKQYKITLLIENSIFNYPFNETAIAANVNPPVIGFFSSYKEIDYILKKVKCDFLLDFAHAYVTSLNKGEDYKKFINGLMKFKPTMFHLCDGIVNDLIDRHMPLGKGNYDLQFFLSLIKNKDVTLEISPVTLENFLDSKKYIQDYLKLKE